MGVRGPFGSAWPVEAVEGSDVVLVAGGVGLAPLRPAIYHILTNRERYGRLVILYGARTPRDILFRAELEKWSSRLDTFVDVTVDRASGRVAWQRRCGDQTDRPGRVRSRQYRGDDLRARNNDAVHHPGAQRSWREQRADPCFHGAQHEVCGRVLRALSVWRAVRVPRRSSVQF